MRKAQPYLRAGMLAALLCAIAACGPVVPPFSAGTVAAGTALKADVDAELAKGAEPFAQHAAEVTALETRLSGAATDAAAIPHNENVAAQWRIMADPAQGLAGGLFARWRRDGTLNPIVVEDGRRQVAEGFTFILCLENNKRGGPSCTPGAGGGN